MSVVLVGGQSLTAWAEYYKIKLPAFEGPYLTIDADFPGTKTEAEVIARELGSNAQIPSIDDHAPNTATIDFTGASGKKLHIDILSGVLGLKSDAVVSRLYQSFGSATITWFPDGLRSHRTPGSSA